jgi:hypothetical protein
MFVALWLAVTCGRFRKKKMAVQYTDQEMIPARNARNVVMFVTIQLENILPSKITDY